MRGRERGRRRELRELRGVPEGGAQVQARPAEEERRRSLLRVRRGEQDWDLHRVDDNPRGSIRAPPRNFLVGDMGQFVADSRHIARAVHRLQRALKALIPAHFFITGLITAIVEPLVAPAGEPYPRVHPEYAEADAHQTQASRAREAEIDEGEARHEEGIEGCPKDGRAPGDHNIIG